MYSFLKVLLGFAQVMLTPTKETFKNIHYIEIKIVTLNPSSAIKTLTKDEKHIFN